MKPPAQSTNRPPSGNSYRETPIAEAFRTPQVRTSRPPADAPATPAAPVYSILLTLGFGGSLLFLSIQRDLLLGQIAAVVLTTMTLHGLWRGGFRKFIMLGLAVGLIAFGPSLQAAVSGAIAQTTGRPAGLGGFAVTGIGATLLWLICHFGTKSFRKRVINKRKGMLFVDRLSGAGLGLAEGAVLVLSVCWLSTSLQPFAKTITDPQLSPKGSPRAQIGETMLRLAKESRSGALADITQGSNPIASIPALSKAVNDLNTSGQIRPENIDPKMAEQLRELLKNLPGGTDLNPVLQSPNGAVSLEKVLNQRPE